MGMYNEVFCRCPRCGGTGYMQIAQLNQCGGFGGWWIDDPDSLTRLSDSELRLLHERVLDGNFVCGHKQEPFDGPIERGCGNYFNPLRDKELEQHRDAHRQLIKDLFGC